MTRSENEQHNDTVDEEARRIAAAKLTGYRNWVLGLDQQVSVEIITPTERADTIARVLAARDAIIKALGTRADTSDAFYIEANTDPLTQLPNRRYFDAEYTRLVNSGQPFGYLHIDLDHFKEKNDEWGHGGGDEVLVQTALRMTSKIRQVTIQRPGFKFFERADPNQPADIAARTGGDEFSILLPGVNNEAQLLARAEEIRTAISGIPYVIGDTNKTRTFASVSASIGAGIYRGEDPKQFAQQVDSRLYLAKRQRNKTVITDRK